jgi:hypothetical protein
MPRRVGSPKAFVIADTVAVNAPASRSAETAAAALAALAAAVGADPAVMTGIWLGLGWFRGTPVFYLCA